MVATPAKLTVASPQSTSAQGSGQVHLGDEDLGHGQAELALAPPHVVADRRLGDVGAVLVEQSPPDPLRGVALLARSLLVGLKPAVDQRPVGAELRRRALGRRALGGWQRRGERLADRPPVDAVAARQLPD